MENGLTFNNNWMTFGLLDFLETASTSNLLDVITVQNSYNLIPAATLHVATSTTFPPLVHHLGIHLGTFLWSSANPLVHFGLWIWPCRRASPDAAGGGRPGFRSPENWFLHCLPGWLPVHSPPASCHDTKWHAQTSHPHVSYGEAYQYNTMARAECAPRPGAMPHQDFADLHFENFAFGNVDCCVLRRGPPHDSGNGK